MRYDNIVCRFNTCLLQQANSFRGENQKHILFYVVMTGMYGKHGFNCIIYFRGIYMNMNIYDRPVDYLGCHG